MPKLDGTGPMGLGSRTGRGFGICRGLFGCWGFGLRRFASSKNELQILEEEEKMLEEELKAIKEEKELLKGQKTK